MERGQEGDKEKRKSQRIKIALPIKFKGSQKNLQKNGTTQDISGHGLSITTSNKDFLQDLKTVLNRKVEVSLFLGQENSPVRIFCQVAWSKLIEKHQIKIGLKFLNFEDQTPYIDFFCEKLISSSLKKEKKEKEL